MKYSKADVAAAREAIEADEAILKLALPAVIARIRGNIAVMQAYHDERSDRWQESKASDPVREAIQRAQRFADGCAVAAGEEPVNHTMAKRLW